MKDARLKIVKNPLTGKEEERFFEDDFISSKNELHINQSGYYHVYKISELNIEIMTQILKSDMSSSYRKYITEERYREDKILDAQLGIPMSEGKPEVHFADKLVTRNDLIEMLKMMEVMEKFRD